VGILGRELSVENDRVFVADDGWIFGCTPHIFVRGFGCRRRFLPTVASRPGCKIIPESARPPSSPQSVQGFGRGMFGEWEGLGKRMFGERGKGRGGAIPPGALPRADDYALSELVKTCGDSLRGILFIPLPSGFWGCHHSIGGKRTTPSTFGRYPSTGGEPNDQTLSELAKTCGDSRRGIVCRERSRLRGGRRVSARLFGPCLRPQITFDPRFFYR
jgi:hypothetical protein